MVRWGLAPRSRGRAGGSTWSTRGTSRGALERAADAPAGTYPVAEPREHAWSELVDTLAEAARTPASAAAAPGPPGEIGRRRSRERAAGSWAGRAVFNREKAEEMLAPAWVCELSGSEGLLPAEDATPLADGIADTVSWYTRQGWL